MHLYDVYMHFHLVDVLLKLHDKYHNMPDY